MLQRKVDYRHNSTMCVVSHSLYNRLSKLAAPLSGTDGVVELAFNHRGHRFSLLMPPNGRH
jgi:hypothetical protein